MNSTTPCSGAPALPRVGDALQEVFRRFSRNDRSFKRLLLAVQEMTGAGRRAALVHPLHRNEAGEGDRPSHTCAPCSKPGLEGGTSPGPGDFDSPYDSREGWQVGVERLNNLDHHRKQLLQKQRLDFSSLPDHTAAHARIFRNPAATVTERHVTITHPAIGSRV